MEATMGYFKKLDTLTELVGERERLSETCDRSRLEIVVVEEQINLLLKDIHF